MAMRHLPKHLRPRYRYLAVEIEAWPDAALDRQALQAAVWSAGRTLLGDAASAAVDLQVIEVDYWRGGGAAIVRVRRGETDAARAALATIERIAGEPVRVGVRGIGGTVKATRKHHLGGPPPQEATESIQFRGRNGTAVYRDDRVDVSVDGHFVGTTPEAL